MSESLAKRSLFSVSSAYLQSEGGVSECKGQKERERERERERNREKRLLVFTSQVHSSMRTFSKMDASEPAGPCCKKVPNHE